MHKIDTETIRKSRNEELAECTMAEVPELSQESKFSAEVLLESVSEFDSQNNRKEISEIFVDPLNVSILNLGQILFHFMPYTILKFHFLQDILFLVMGNRLSALIDELKSDLCSFQLVRKVVNVITEFLWPNGKLIEINPEERTLEDKIKTEKEAIRLISKLLLKSKAQLSENNSMKIAFELISSFKDVTINKHIFFCVLDAIFNVVYKHEN